MTEQFIAIVAAGFSFGVLVGVVLTVYVMLR